MRLTGAKCQCTACDLGFGSERAFDRHRYGEISDRQCLTVSEMRAGGWAQNHRGFWLVPDPRRAGDEPQAPRIPPRASEPQVSGEMALNGEFAGGGR